MKRLLAAGSGDLSIAHAFRAGERGRRHNPEFLLLEWYRPGFDDGALMDEIEALLASVLPGPAPLRLPFAALVGGAFDVDPLTADNEALAAALTGHWAHIGREGDPLHLTDGRRAGLLDLLYAEASERIEGRAFITDFPPEMSALARLREDDAGRRVAARFELVVDGVELANGFMSSLMRTSNARASRQISKIVRPGVGSRRTSTSVFSRRSRPDCRIAPVLRWASTDC